MICCVHGYGADSGWLVQLTCIHLAKQGYAVYAIDHQGHGKSEGLKGHLPDMNAVVDDCIEYFDSKRDGRTSFLYGESLGGAIALLIHLKQKEVWKGLVLNGAMCGIGRFKPPWVAIQLLPLVASKCCSFLLCEHGDFVKVFVMCELCVTVCVEGLLMWFSS